MDHGTRDAPPSTLGDNEYPMSIDDNGMEAGASASVQRDRPPPEGEPPAARQRSDGDAQDTMDFDMEEAYADEQAIEDELHGGGPPAHTRVPGLDDESQAGADANAADLDEVASQGGDGTDAAGSDEPAIGDVDFDEQGLRAKVLYSDADPDWDALSAEFNTGTPGFAGWFGQQMSSLTGARAKFIPALRQVERAGSYAAALGIDDNTGDLDERAVAQRHAHRKIAVLLHPDKHGSAPSDFKARIEAAMKRLNDAKDADAAELDQPFEDVPEGGARTPG